MAMRGGRGGRALRVTRTYSATVSGDVPRPTPSPAQPVQDYPSSIISAGNRRDSDVSSFCSSLPSSVGSRPAYPTASSSSDRASILSAVNSYLSSLSPPIYLKSPLPSAREITAAFHRLLSRLDSGSSLNDLMRNLPRLLSNLKCPIKLSKSALKAPSSPHAWPSVVSVLYWLVQLARLADHLDYSPSFSSVSDVHRFISESYCLFLEGEDSVIEDLAEEFRDRLNRHVSYAIKECEDLETEVAQLEAKLRDLAGAPTKLEALEAEKAVLLEDEKKFQNVIDKFSEKIEEKKKKLAERERELETRVLEKKSLDEENEALRQRIQGQALSVMDVEMLEKELQALERDIFEGENRRKEMDEKGWQLVQEIERKFRGLQTLTEESNRAIRELKIGNNFQYILNPKASSAAEVIGIDYKTLLKPALSALAEEAKKSMILKAEEQINLLKQSHENDLMLDGKRAQCTTMQTEINEFEAQIDRLKKKVEDHTMEHSLEAEKLKEELSAKELEAGILERNAQDLLMESEENLKRTIIKCRGETHLCAQELYALIESVSKDKEFLSSTISGIMEELKEIAEGVKLAFQTSMLDS